MDLKFTGFMKTAQLIVDESLAVKPGEKVLITTDTCVSDYPGIEELVKSLFAVMVERGVDPAIMTYDARMKKGSELPEIVLNAAMDSDVLIALNSTSYLHSAGFPKILTKPIRILLLPAGESVKRGGDSVYRLMPRTKEELVNVAEMTRAVANRLTDAPHKVRFTAPNGTDVTFSLGKLKPHLATGICTEPGFEILPNGQMALGVDEGSANGKVVIDAEVALIHRVLKDPITYNVENGVVTSIEGTGDAQILRDLVAAVDYPDRMKLNFAEFGLGLNKKAQLNGDSSEGERIYGAAHIGIGSNAAFGGSIFIPAWHFDAIIPQATVEVDGTLIAKDGEYLL